MNTKNKYFSILFYLFILIAFVSCKSSVKITAISSQDTKVDVNLDLGKLLSETIVSLTGLTGDTQNGSFVFNKTEMEQSLQNNNFLDSVVTPVGQTGVTVSTTVKKGTYADFITNDKDKLTVNFTPDSIKNLFAVLGEDYMAYTSLLMAPVFTDEALSPEEYKEILAAVYGTELAEEVTGGDIELTLVGQKGKKQVYTIKLIDILTLKTKLTYSVSNL